MSPQCNLFCHHFINYTKTFWSESKPTDSVTGRILKKKLVKMLDEKMWPDMVALHVAPCWLDPTLKPFSFIKNIPDRTALLKQAQHIVRSNCTAVANELNCEENADVEEIAVELNNEADDDDGCVHTDSESLIPWQNFAIYLHQMD